MPREGSETLRHIPTEKCPHCGEQVRPNRFQYVLKDLDPDRDDSAVIESGNACEECFEELRTIVTS